MTVIENSDLVDFHPDLLNNSQSKAYDIVEKHFHNPEKQLLVIITGLAGSGKSFAVEGIRSLLNHSYHLLKRFNHHPPPHLHHQLLLQLLVSNRFILCHSRKYV